MAFQHGVNVQFQTKGVTQIPTLETNVIFLVGTAPTTGNNNTLTVVTNARDDVAQFGSPVPGFTIPQALEALRANGAGRVVVCNVFDSGTMLTAVSDEEVTVANGKVTLANAPIGTITVENSAEDTVYVAGTDYSVDAYGVVTILAGGSITAAQALKVTYSHLNTAAVTSATVVGSVSGQTYTGLKMGSVIKNTFGYGANIILCPTYCEIAAVATEMQTQAEALNCMFLVDAPSFTTSSDSISDVVAERGIGGTYAGFQSTSKNAILCYPYVKKFDTATNASVNYPSSPYIAGVMARTDTQQGYWFSPSNKEVQGILGTEIIMAGDIDSATSDPNLLNAAGITTIARIEQSSYRVWGNRSAAFPSVTTADNFIAARRTMFVMDAGLKKMAVQYNGLPLTSALIQQLISEAESFLDTLKQNGALIDFTVYYLAEENPASQLQNGQVVLSIDFAPTVSAELITFKAYLNGDLYETINEALANA